MLFICVFFFFFFCSFFVAVVDVSAPLGQASKLPVAPLAAFCLRGGIGIDTEKYLKPVPKTLSFMYEVQNMLIDEVESIWSAIDERDDWQPLYDKVDAIRRMGAAHGPAPTPAGHATG